VIILYNIELFHYIISISDGRTSEYNSSVPDRRESADVDVITQTDENVNVTFSATTTATADNDERPIEYHHHLKKRKLALLAAATSDCSSVAEEATVKQCPPNDIEKFLSLRKQVLI
jgi:hypothetical protein